MRTYHTEVIGCKVNQYEAQQISEFFERSGLITAQPDQPPDLAIVHSCAVTARAVAKTRQTVARLLNAGAKAVILSGCAVRADTAEFREFGPKVVLAPQAQDIVNVLYDITLNQGVSDKTSTDINQGSKATGRNKQCMMAPKPKAAAAVGNPVSRAKPLSNHIQAGPQRQVKEEFLSPQPHTGLVLAPINRFFGHQRAFVKVQDGCDAFCSYCIIPYLRPRLSSPTPEEVIQQISLLVRNGYREVVLTGIHLGAYGQSTTRRKGPSDQTPVALADLLARAAPIQGLERIRLSSLEPSELSDQLLEVISSNPVVARHLHLPLQSGSESVLRRMNRPYSPQQYLDAVARARRYSDSMTVTTDVIVGFPGETEDDFQATMALAQQVSFARIHVFEFSPRAGTAAADMPEQLPKAVRQQRSQQLRELADTLAQQHRQKLIGQKLHVLVEGKAGHEGLANGLCEQYFNVRFESKEKLTGKLVPVLLEKVDKSGSFGRLLVA